MENIKAFTGKYRKYLVAFNGKYQGNHWNISKREKEEKERKRGEIRESNKKY